MILVIFDGFIMLSIIISLINATEIEFSYNYDVFLVWLSTLMCIYFRFISEFSFGLLNFMVQGAFLMTILIFIGLSNENILFLQM